MAWSYENENQYWAEQKYYYDVDITCKLCQTIITNKSKHNGRPLVIGVVCGACNATKVIPQRLLEWERENLN